MVSNGPFRRKRKLYRMTVCFLLSIYFNNLFEFGDINTELHRPLQPAT